MKNWLKQQAVCLTLLMAGPAVAAEQSTDFELIKNKIQSTLGMQVVSLADAPVNGLVQLETDKGLFYSSTDGQFFLQARIYNLDQGMRNETEVTLRKMRLAGIEEFKDAAIEYKADKEKYVVSVFTDINCGYCRKLHNEMKQFNDLGITVRYLAYPREGLRSATYQSMVSVWCAENRQQAMDNAKNGNSVTKKNCDSKVSEQYAFGQQVGVNGTPNIILPDGSVIPGYQPPAMLAAALEELTQ